jgi:hypothetical protein
MEEKYQLVEAINSALKSEKVKLTKAEKECLIKHRDSLLNPKSKPDYTGIILNIMKLFVVACDIGQKLNE